MSCSRRPVRRSTADATPTTTLQGIGSTTPTAKANLSVANPVAGRWEIVITLAPDDLRPGVQPDDQRLRDVRQLRGDGVVRVAAPWPCRALAQGTPQTVQLQVTNTTGIGRTFSFTSSVRRHRPGQHLHPGGRDRAGVADADPDGRSRDGRLRHVGGHDQLVVPAAAARDAAARADGDALAVHLKHGRAGGNDRRRRHKKAVPLAVGPGGRPRAARDCSLESTASGA